MQSNTTSRTKTLAELNDLIETLEEAKTRAMEGESIEILTVGNKPVVFPLSNTIKSGCFEIEVLPDPDILKKQA